MKCGEVLEQLSDCNCLKKNPPVVAVECLTLLHILEVLVSNLDPETSRTLTDSNKLESVQRKFANLYYYRFLQFDILRIYDLIFNCLYSRTLNSRR
jgi:hypothetical protein